MENKDLMPIPQVLLFDCSDEVRESLVEHRFSVKEATFGKDVIVEYNRAGEAALPLIWSVPSNIHEYEVIIVDMCGVDDAITMKDIPEDHTSLIRYSIEPPSKTFFASVMSSRLVFEGESKPQKAIYIVFEGDYIEGSYQAFNLRTRGHERISGCTYDFLKNIIEYNIDVNRKTGKRTIIATEKKLSSILTKYNNSFSYLVTFDHPIIYDSSTKISTERADFLPLVLNDNNEIISFICFSEDNVILVLPQTSRKRELVLELLEDYFPTLMPEFFPESTKFLWLSDQKYVLPNANAFEERKQAAQGEYEAKVKQIDEEIIENNKKFGFLLDLLKETDDLLVKAVIAWFKWLGFQNVIDVDHEKATKQEDINIIEDDFVIIAEVKGIGGTSTDSECNQISKHRRRHEKANRGKEIHPVYIVNHQRFISPELRSNPPFTKDQLDYAFHDERGLVTTYQLFIWHKLISDGIFSSDEVKEALTQFGAISLVPPSYTKIGMITKYFPKKNAFIITIKNTKVKVGDSLLFEKGTEFQKSVIGSIQDNGVEVKNIANGEVGIMVKAQLGTGYNVYLCPNYEE